MPVRLVRLMGGRKRRLIWMQCRLQYTIGSRSFTKLDLGELMERESKLKAEVKREQMADLIANGLGNPHNLFVRF